MTDWIKPKKLQSGARIGIVSPSYWLESERLKQAGVFLESLGFEVVLGKSTQLHEDKFAGSPEARATDIMAMFQRQDIDAIFCARGGYGANRLLDKLDYQVIRDNPKIFMGYSDITGLLSSIAQRAGLVCFHGPMLSSFTDGVSDYVRTNFLRLLSGEENLVIDSPTGCRAQCLRAGRAEGELWGGNLSLIIERLGTADQINLDNKLLFIEEVGERFHVFDRMMYHLKHSGSLDNIVGLVVGEMTEMLDSEPRYGKSLDEIVMEHCGDLNIPVISNFPCGHGEYIATLPVGHKVRLEANSDNSHLLITGSPVQ
jgi:muramoyltetrapeptide carboxypeptidase